MIASIRMILFCEMILQIPECFIKVKIPLLKVKIPLLKVKIQQNSRKMRNLNTCWPKFISAQLQSAEVQIVTLYLTKSYTQNIQEKNSIKETKKEIKRQLIAITLVVFCFCFW